MNPWEDMQPLDTALGYQFVSRFQQEPTITPPPSQDAMDVALGCPSLTNWPSEVTVEAPCQGGQWLDNKNQLLSWSESCSMNFINDHDIAPTVEYTLGNGDLFGVSQTKTTLMGTLMVLMNCQRKEIFLIEELVIKQRGQADSDSCEKYDSCDGTIYIQYIMKHRNNGMVVAKTPYLNIFQDTFQITDNDGAEIATATRKGTWDPRQPNCNAAEAPGWILAFNGQAPGIFGNAANQWPIAMLMTMASLRDQYRRSNGWVASSVCEYIKGCLLVIVVGLLVCCCCGIPLLMWFFCGGECMRYFVLMERRFCPRLSGRKSLWRQKG